MLLGFNLLLWTTHVTEEHFPIFARPQAHRLRRRRGAAVRGRRRSTSRASAACCATRACAAPASPCCPTRRISAHRRTRRAAQGAARAAALGRRLPHGCGGEVLAGPFHQPLGVFTGDPPTAAERERLVEVHRQAADYAARPGSRCRSSRSTGSSATC